MSGTEWGFGQMDCYASLVQENVSVTIESRSVTANTLCLSVGAPPTVLRRHLGPVDVRHRRPF